MVRMGPPISSVVLATVASVSAEHQVNHRRPLEPKVLTTHFPRRRKIRATLCRQHMPKAASHTAYNRAALKLVSNPSSALLSSDMLRSEGTGRSKGPPSKS